MVSSGLLVITSISVCQDALVLIEMATNQQICAAVLAMKSNKKIKKKIKIGYQKRNEYSHVDLDFIFYKQLSLRYMLIKSSRHCDFFSWDMLKILSF